MTGALQVAELESPLGRHLAASTERGLCFFALRSEGARARLDAWIAEHAPGATVGPGAERLLDVERQVAEYWAGERKRFELELDLRGTPFQLDVWRELERIPFGVTRTYGELAKRLGRPGSSRAVGAANGRNPVPLVVPCHRVVAGEGLGGFTGGLELKRELLRHEGVLLFG